MSKEIKVGILTLVSITVFILGYAFIKDSKLLDTSKVYYAEYDKVDGLLKSSAVKINGYQIGKVIAIDLLLNEGGKIKVTLQVDGDVDLPDNSVALLYSADLLGDKSINILLGNSNSFYQDGDYINTEIEKELMESLGSTLTPMTDNLNRTLSSADSLMNNFNHLFGGESDPRSLDYTIATLNRSLANLNIATSQLAVASTNPNSDMQQTLKGISSLARVLEKNANNIDQMLANLNTMSNNFSAIDLEETLTKTNQTLDGLNSTFSTMNNGEGTLGALTKDKELYDNLNTASLSLDTLLSDFQARPERYVHVSVFGNPERRAERYRKRKARREAREKKKEED